MIRTENIVTISPGYFKDIAKNTIVFGAFVKKGEDADPVFQEIPEGRPKEDLQLLRLLLNNASDKTFELVQTCRQEKGLFIGNAWYNLPEVLPVLN